MALYAPVAFSCATCGKHPVSENESGEAQDRKLIKREKHFKRISTSKTSTPSKEDSTLSKETVEEVTNNSDNSVKNDQI